MTREGPNIRLDVDCYGCIYMENESYCCQSDSGFKIYCIHVNHGEEGKRRRYLGDTNWRTPYWCPLKSAALAAFLAAKDKEIEGWQAERNIAQQERDNLAARLAVVAEALQEALVEADEISLADLPAARTRADAIVSSCDRALTDLPAHAAALLRVVEAARGIDLLFYKEGGYPSWNVGRGRHLDQRAPELRSALRALDGEEK